MADIHAIAKQLEQLTEELVARVPEHLFVQHLLPMIAGDEGHTNLEVWNHLAGSVFNKIAVVAPSGDVLFTLPPLATSPITPKDRESSNALFEIMNGYELRAKLSPIYARNYFENAIQGKMVMEKRDYAQLKAIDEILVRYDRKPHLPPNFDPTKLTVTPTAEGNEEEDEVGDDL